jgi:hypothetical protein
MGEMFILIPRRHNEVKLFPMLGLQLQFQQIRRGEKNGFLVKAEERRLIMNTFK